MKKKQKFVIGGVVLLLALGFLLYRGLASASYYYEVGELLARGSSAYGETVKVNGQVAPGSLEQGALGTTLRFTIVDTKDSGKSLAVFFQGVVPDSFKVGNEVVAEGKLNKDGVFQASSLMPKCPSKYRPLG